MGLNSAGSDRRPHDETRPDRRRLAALRPRRALRASVATVGASGGTIATRAAYVGSVTTTGFDLRGREVTTLGPVQALTDAGCVTVTPSGGGTPVITATRR